MDVPTSVLDIKSVSIFVLIRFRQMLMFFLDRELYRYIYIGIGVCTWTCGGTHILVLFYIGSIPILYVARNTLYTRILVYSYTPLWNPPRDRLASP